MPFFEPLPPEPPHPELLQPTGWRHPVWDRPSEAVLGGPVGVALLVAKNEELALVVDDIHAYPNGFTFSLAIVRNPMAPREPLDPGLMGMGHPFARRGPRIGFEFADGSRVQEQGPSHAGFPRGHTVSTQMLVTGRGPDPRGAPTNPFGVRADADGVPVEPVLIPRGGGGGSERFEMRFWCFPLPPPGPMTAYVEWADRAISEASVAFDADLVREAALGAVTLWEPDGTGDASR